VSNIKFLFFGFYTQTLVSSVSVKNSLNFNQISNESYSDGLLRVTGITKSSASTTNVFTKVNNSLIKNLFSIFGLIFGIFGFGLVVLYILILISYKCEFILPSVLTLTITNVTVLLFSFYNSNLAIETSLLNFASSLIKVNYNNLEVGSTPLKVQEKYFSKYESTYFTDKKCSDA
jgi:hypothetical protein